MVNMSSEKLYNKMAWSEERGQLACGETVKYFIVSTPALADNSKVSQGQFIITSYSKIMPIWHIPTTEHFLGFPIANEHTTS